jgi:hypothetical protein
MGDTMLEYPETMVLVGVPVAVLVTLAVQALKSAGLAGRWAPLVAVLLASVLVGLAELAVVVSWIEPVSRVLAGGLVSGLASSGGYSWARSVGKDGGEHVHPDA